MMAPLEKPSLSTAIQTQGIMHPEAVETYGKSKVMLRIGNGGPGATGLLKALAEDYLATREDDGSIEWICNHSRNSQLAMLMGHVDLALTYERDQEKISLAEKWAVNAGCVFHDHFCVVGPFDDPAIIKDAKSPQEAFSQIARTQNLFHGRADGSAIMHKEHSIWQGAHLAPWKDETTSNWYKTISQSPADALIEADACGAYLLIDRSTLLAQTIWQRVVASTVYFEPTNPDHVLMNSCHALYPPHAPLETRTEINNFLAYVRSPRGQRVIAQLGKDQSGLSLFAPIVERATRPELTGGGIMPEEADGGPRDGTRANFEEIDHTVLQQ